MTKEELHQHLVILRFVVAAILTVFLALGAALVLAVGLSVEWNSKVFAGYLISVTLTAPPFVAAGTIADRISQSVVKRLYTKTLIRLASTILITQLAAFLVFMLDAGIAPLLLGEGTGIIMLLFGVWPRRPVVNR